MILIHSIFVFPFIVERIGRTGLFPADQADCLWIRTILKAHFWKATIQLLGWKRLGICNNFPHVCWATNIAGKIQSNEGNWILKRWMVTKRGYTIPAGNWISEYLTDSKDLYSGDLLELNVWDLSMDAFSSRPEYAVLTNGGSNSTGYDNLSATTEGYFTPPIYYVYPSVLAAKVVAVALIILVTVVGNSIVITIILSNKHMRTTTYYYLMNLAVADMTIALISEWTWLVNHLARYWMFGKAMCKLSALLQGKYSEKHFRVKTDQEKGPRMPDTFWGPRVQIRKIILFCFFLE